MSSLRPPTVWASSTISTNATSHAPAQIMFKTFFQIATNKETTVNELVDIMLPVMQAHCEHEIKIIYGEQRLGDVMRNFSDTRKAQEKLGWQAKTSIPEGVAKVIDFFKSSYAI